MIGYAPFAVWEKTLSRKRISGLTAKIHSAERFLSAFFVQKISAERLPGADMFLINP